MNGLWSSHAMGWPQSVLHCLIVTRGFKMVQISPAVGSAKGDLTEMTEMKTLTWLDNPTFIDDVPMEFSISERIFQLATWDYRRVSQFWCLVTTPDAIYCQPYSVGIPGFHFESRLGSLRNHGDNVRMGNIRIKRASILKHSSRWHCWLMLVIIYPISNYFILFPTEATR